MDTNNSKEIEVEGEVCMECEQSLAAEDDREITEGGVYCRPCFTRLARDVKAIIEEQSSNINLPLAFIGAIVGGAVGVVAWWGVTVVTGWNIGIIAVVISIAVAKGILFTTGGKRSLQLQVMAVAVSILAYLYANYLVLRTFVIKENNELEQILTLIPNVDIFIEATKNSLDGMSLLFLGIVVWVAWQNTKPIQIG